MEEWTTEDYQRYQQSGGAVRLPGKKCSRRKRETTSEEEKRFENQLFDEMKAAGISVEREVKFHKKRQWRIDFVLRDFNIAIEVEGGIYSHGRHVRGTGYEADCEKYNEVEISGLQLLRFTTGQVKKGKALPVILRAIEKQQQERRKNGCS